MFHLKYCVFLNKWSDHNGANRNTVSFIVALNGKTIWSQIKSGLNGALAPGGPPTGKGGIGFLKHMDFQQSFFGSVRNLLNSGSLRGGG